MINRGVNRSDVFCILQRPHSYAYFRSMHQSYDRNWREMGIVCGAYLGAIQAQSRLCQRNFIRWWTLNEQVNLLDQEYRRALDQIRQNFTDSGITIYNMKRIHSRHLAQP